jgi:hypothetical protein
VPPSIPLDRFNRIVQAADPVAEITGLVNPTSPISEDDWLDCKLEPSNISDPTKREKKIKEMWLRALCGFANNEGGVLIWGLDARKDPKTGVDHIDKVVPVTDPHGLKSKLTEWRREGTDPPLANVQVEAYEDQPGSGQGFVVCYVPEGPYKPYRTREGPTSQYWLRTSDNFVVMSSAVLRAMFHPRAKAVFVLEATLSWNPEAESPNPLTRMVLQVRVANRGTASARDIVLRTEHNLGQYASDSSAMAPWRQEKKGILRDLVTMHPGTPWEEVVRWVWAVPGKPQVPGQWRPILPACPDPELRFAVYAEDQEPQFFEVTFDMGSLVVEHKVVMEASPREAF